MSSFCRRFLIVFILLFSVLNVLACSNNDSPNDKQPNGNDNDNLPNGNDELPNDNGDEIKPDSFPLLSDFSEDEQAMLKTAGSGFNSNSGNVNNSGLVTSYFLNQAHYISLGNEVYVFDVLTQTFEKLFHLEQGYTASHLVYLNNKLYFIHSEEDFLYVYDFDTESITIVLESQCIRVYPYGNRLMLTHFTERPYYNDSVETYGIFDPSNGSIYNVNYGAEFFSTYANTRNYFKPHGTMRIDVRAPNGAGSTLVNLADYNVTDIHEMFILYFDQNHVSHLVMILTINNEKGLYIYRSNEEGLIKLQAGNITNLNYAHGNIYYVHNNTLYKVDEKNLEDIENIYDFDQTVDAVLWIDQFLYYRYLDSNELYVRHPITEGAYKLPLND